MNLKSLFNEQYRKKAIYPIKRILRLFKGKKHSTPVFVFGKQRSGTNMVIDVMRLHPKCWLRTVKNLLFASRLLWIVI